MLSGKESVSADKAIINNEPLELRRSTRVNVGVAKPRFDYEKKEVNFTCSLSATDFSSNYHISITKGLKEIDLPVEKAIMAELQQFIALKVFESVKISNNKEFLRSSMFITEKLEGQGNHLKWKARMVADGSMQEKQLFSNNSSPTINADAVKCILKVAIVEKRKIMVIDVTGAYLHAAMDQEICMIMNSKVVSILENLDSQVSNFKRRNGTLKVRLLKALYGCRQSTKLWYEHFIKFLNEMGFTENSAKRCAWILMRNNSQITVVFHVDDNLVTSEFQENLDWFLTAMKKEFKDVKAQSGPVYTLLGMSLDKNKSKQKESISFGFVLQFST